MAEGRYVIVSGARSPAALHAARALHAAGYRVVTVDCVRFPVARFSNASHEHRRHRSPVTNPVAFRYDVLDLLRKYDPVAWIPTCEETFHLARMEDERVSRVLFAPSLDKLRRAHDKYEFAQDAAEMGYGPAETILLSFSWKNIRHLEAGSRDYVLKPVYSRFAERVIVKPTLPELMNVSLEAKRTPWVAQSYLPGEELCSYSIARGGRIVAHATYRGLHRAGSGASIMFEPVIDRDAAFFAMAYAHRTNWTGQLSFDFRRDAKGELKAIECNPRATSGIHLLKADAALGHALAGTGTEAPAHEWGTPMVGAAMLTYGLSSAFGCDSLGPWRKDFAKGKDVLGVKGDRLPAFAQALSVAEFGLKSLRHRVSMTAATTRDIEWNGK